MEDLIEYELINICIEPAYQLPDDERGFACEDEPSSDDVPQVEYDADGIPMGGTREEIEMRKNIVYDFIQQWRASHKDTPYIYNENIKENIKITQVFMIESVAHSVGNYNSTKAILRFEEVMTKACKIGITKTKEGNSNQRPFTDMIVMRYKTDDIGNVKMTVGVRARTKEKTAYSITVPGKDTPFINESLRSSPKNKKKKHHK